MRPDIRGCLGSHADACLRQHHPVYRNSTRRLYVWTWLRQFLGRTFPRPNPQPKECLCPHRNGPWRLRRLLHRCPCVCSTPPHFSFPVRLRCPSGPGGCPSTHCRRHSSRAHNPHGCDPTDLVPDLGSVPQHRPRRQPIVCGQYPGCSPGGVPLRLRGDPGPGPERHHLLWRSPEHPPRPHHPQVALGRAGTSARRQIHASPGPRPYFRARCLSRCWFHRYDA